MSATCTPHDLFGAPTLCEPIQTGALYSVAVLALVLALIIYSLVMLVREQRDKRIRRRETAAAHEFWDEPAPVRPPSKASVVLARRLARRVEVAPAETVLLHTPPIPAPPLPEAPHE